MCLATCPGGAVKIAYFGSGWTAAPWESSRPWPHVADALGVRMDVRIEGICLHLCPYRRHLVNCDRC